MITRLETKPLDQDYFCGHADCIDCKFLSMCTKDQNEFDREKLIAKKRNNHCPICGFVTGVTWNKKIMCLDCGHVLDQETPIVKETLPDLDDGHDADQLDNSFYAEGDPSEWYGA